MMPSSLEDFEMEFTSLGDTKRDMLKDLELEWVEQQTGLQTYYTSARGEGNSVEASTKHILISCISEAAENEEDERLLSESVEDAKQKLYDSRNFKRALNFATGGSGAAYDSQ